MPDIAWNKRTWDDAYDWSREGEEWSDAWGGSDSVWYAAILPRIASFLPARSVLEIGPGFGRWTRYLMINCSFYKGIDLSEKCVAACRKRFANREGAAFYASDGKSLSVIGTEKYDLVFSFESLVHAGMDALGGYIPDIVDRLAPGGVAFIHHSNLAAYEGTEFAHRASDISAEIFADLVRAYGGRVLIQERLHVGSGLMPDCYTLLSRADDYRDAVTRDLTDSNVAAFSIYCAQHVYQHYLKISPKFDRRLR